LYASFLLKINSQCPNFDISHASAGRQPTEIPSHTPSLVLIATITHPRQCVKKYARGTPLGKKAVFT